MASFTLPKLPYDQSALAPHISSETLSFHYGKHHAGYVDRLNSLIKTSDLKSLSLLEIVAKGPSNVPIGIYNAAAQTFNHTFYWLSLRPNPQNKLNSPPPSSSISKLIIQTFGSFDVFKEKFSQSAAGLFGSGWVWLVKDNKANKLVILETKDAVCPVDDKNLTLILVCDVWEHAYYIDYRNNRVQYVKAWWALVNWEFAEGNLKAVGGGTVSRL
ncbi:UNVERIFIED_CONTAM: Superoxide dismutase [Siphonaria sp. JEL0065]|nr:Superoxide dismutase [Siphonaria sp. JEL0065]